MVTRARGAGEAQRPTGVRLPKGTAASLRKASSDPFMARSTEDWLGTLATMLAEAEQYGHISYDAYRATFDLGRTLRLTHIELV